MMKIGGLASAFLAIALLAPAPAAAQGEAAYGEARAKLAQAKQNRNKHPRAYVDAILEYGKATFEKVDKMTVETLLGLLLEELRDDNPSGSKEERIDGQVLEACESALRNVTGKGGVDLMIKEIRNPQRNVRARFSLCRALGVQKGGDALKVLVDMLQERDPRLQIGAVDGLKEQLKTALAKKVDDLVAQVQSGRDQASQIQATAGKALEAKPAELFKLRCDGLALQLEGVMTGFTPKDDLLKSMEELRAIANGIAGDEPKGKVVPMVANLTDFTDKFLKSVDELNSARKETEPATTVLLKIIADGKRSWEVRIGAVQALRMDRHSSYVDPLIECLAVSGPDDGRLKVDVMQALAAILGVTDPKTDDPNWWKGALAERKSGKLPGTSGGTTITPTEFFGLKTKSTRIVYILDKTGSMDFRCTESTISKKAPPRKGSEVPTAEEKLAPAEEMAKRKAGETKKKYDDRKIEKRMDALKREFINSIYYLDPRVYFGVVTYEANPTNWRPQLMQATWVNKMACIQDADKISPSGGTNIWDGLENAFRFVAEPKRPEVIAFDNKGNYVTTVNGADTFFLMTDGNHNQGRFAGGQDFDERAFLAEFRKINTLRRVVVNTIILGDTTQSADNQDPIKQKSLSLFRSIAEISGGAFVHVGE